MPQRDYPAAKVQKYNSGKISRPRAKGLKNRVRSLLLQNNSPQHFSFVLNNGNQGNGNPLQYSCLENPMDRGTWQATVHGVANSQTQLSNFNLTFFCFIDYAKAFDCVDHNELWKTLQEMGIPDHLTCLLRNLYAG